MELSKILPDTFSSLPDDLDKGEKVWKTWYDHDAPESQPLPGKYKDNLNEFEQLCLLRLVVTTGWLKFIYF